MSNKATAGLKIDIDSRSALRAQRDLDKAAKAAEELANQVESGAKANKDYDDTLKELGSSLVELATESSGAGKMISKIPLGPMATAAGAAVGAVAALGAGALALASQAREAARELNQGLLDAIEDASRGSEDATERFETLENVMRNVRGESDLLARGYDTLDDATAAATAEFARNEAVVRDLDGLIPRLTDSIQRGLVSAYAGWRGEAVATTQAMIENAVATAQAEAAIERLLETFGSGQGAQAMTGMAQSFVDGAGASEEAASQFESVASRLFEDVMFGAVPAGTSAAEAFREINYQMRQSGEITSEVHNEVARLITTEHGRVAIAETVSSAIEELNLMMVEEVEVAEAVAPAVAIVAAEEKNLELILKQQAAARLANASAMEEEKAAGARKLEAMHAELEAMKSLAEEQARQTMADKADSLAATAAAGLDKQMAAQEAVLDARLQKMQTRVQLGVSAIATTMQGLGQAVGDAINGESEKAGKVVLKLIGQILVGLGSAAMAQGAIALIPSLINPAGTPAQGAAFLAAGAAAVAVGAGMGAAASSSPRQSIASTPGGESSGVSSIQNTYNVAFDSFMPERARNRAIVEQVGSSIEAAA